MASCVRNPCTKKTIKIDDVVDVFRRILFISTLISCVLFSPGIAEAHVGWGGNGHLMASCVCPILIIFGTNIPIFLQVTMNNVGDDEKVVGSTPRTVAIKWLILRQVNYKHVSKKVSSLLHTSLCHTLMLTVKHSLFWKTWKRKSIIQIQNPNTTNQWKNVYHKLNIMYNIYSTQRTTKVNSAFHPSGVGKSSTEYQGLRRGAFTCVGWQVTLCDPVGQVTLRSSAMGLPCCQNTHYLTVRYRIELDTFTGPAHHYGNKLSLASDGVSDKLTT